MKNINTDKEWKRWSLLESLTRSISMLLQKIVGVTSTTFGQTFLATAIIGFVQTIAGFLITRKRKIPLLMDKKGVVGSCVFGIFATICTVLGFTVFLLGGDMGINTFIITLAIIPGALIDNFFFKKHLTKREWLGILIGVFAGYSILGWPSLAEIQELPIWIWISLIIMFGVAINQGVTRSIKRTDIFVKNFWGGLTTLILTILAIIVMGPFQIVTEFPPNLWIISVIHGINVIGVWSFNLLSYKAGASIALKKLLVNGSFLTLSIILGVIFFDEAFTTAKIAGVILYFVAFTFMDETTWRYVFRRQK